MKFTQDEYINKISFGNEVLYDMCEQEPLHIDRNIIWSKLWLIGRSYSASIERNRIKKNTETIYNEVTECLKKSKLDQYIEKLNNITYPGFNDISLILEAHYYLLMIFKKYTGLEKVSLASKYLHFHAPKSIFIYDSIVNKKIRSLFKNDKKLQQLYKEEYKRMSNLKANTLYKQHVCRCLVYRNNLEEKLDENLRITPRTLDTRLYKPI